MKTLMVKSRKGPPFEVKGHPVAEHFFAHRDVRHNNRWRIAPPLEETWSDQTF